MDPINCPKCGQPLGNLVKEDGKLIGLHLQNAIATKVDGYCLGCKNPFHFTSSKYYSEDDELRSAPGS